MAHSFIRFFLLCCLSFALPLQAQLPPNQPEQDCINALPVCQDIYFQPNSYDGAGDNPDEINGSNSCMLLGERNSVWYIFRIETGGQLCFTISPVDSLDDYDWALYNLTNTGCASIYSNPNIEVSCNWTYNNGCAGQTGPNGRTDCPGQFEPCIWVSAGETYVLNVSNFTSSNAGYTLDFTPSTAQLYDDIPPDVNSLQSFCYGVTVEFSENVLCNTVDPSDFTFSGPDGPYTISTIRSENCDAGGSFDRSFDLVVSPPIQQAGNYTLELTGFVGDFCGNGANPHMGTVYMPLPPNSSINPQTDQCLEVNQFGFAYDGPSSVRAIQWDFGDGAASTLNFPIHSYADSGTYTVQQVITDVNGCDDTTTLDVVVLPRPEASFDAPSSLCEGDSVFFENLTTFPGAPQSSMTWRIGDGTVTQQVSFGHDFPVPGIYPVQLEAINAFGCRDTAARQLPVYPHADVDFMTEEDVCFGDTADFVYLSSIRTDIANDEIVNWWWVFGDGDSAGMELAPSHLYPSGGAWPVTLFVESDKGCIDSLTQDQIIYQPDPPEITQDPVCFGEQAFLVAIPEDGGITRWFFAETDSTPFQEAAVYPTPPVAYPQTYFVEVFSKQGCYSERVPIEATHHPVGDARIVSSDSVLAFPQPVVTLFLSGDIEADLYAWDLGDGTTSTLPNPAHEYQHPGRYELGLTVLDIHGCEYTFRSVVEVKNLFGFHIPSAFTPNGDGENDEWFIGHYLLSQFSMAVYNRFGEAVFETDNPDFRWDGRSPDGKWVKPGVYVYRVFGVDNLGNPVEKAGTLTLLK